MYLLFQFQMNQKERVIWKFETDFKKPFHSSSSLKMVTWFLSILRSENESGFGEPGGTPPSKIPGKTPQPPDLKPGGTPLYKLCRYVPV